MKSQSQNKSLSPEAKKGLRLTGFSVGLLVLLGFILILANAIYQQVPAYDPPPPPITHHEVSLTHNLKLRWVKDNIFTTRRQLDFNNSPDLTAANGVVFLIGDLDRFTTSILAFSSASGELLWRNPSQDATSIYATSSALYIGLSGNVQRRDLHSGNLIYTSDNFGWRKPVTAIFVENALIYATIISGFVLNEENGKIIEDKGEQVPPEFYKANHLLTENYLFVDRINALLILGLDRHTKQPLWEIETVNISNLAATETTVYFLTQDGRLLGLSNQTGEIVAEVQFELAPFVTCNFDDRNNQPSSYYVAVDK